MGAQWAVKWILNGQMSDIMIDSNSFGSQGLCEYEYKLLCMIFVSSSKTEACCWVLEFYLMCVVSAIRINGFTVQQHCIALFTGMNSS